jgi:anaerobic ribonucleoside-triphosphate reductase activating protein
MTVEEVVKSLSTSSNNVTISGGEPLIQIEAVVDLVRSLSEQGKTCWLYTGFKYEAINYLTILQLFISGVVVLIDGQYEESCKDSSLLFRGSSNQRIIDLQKTLEENRVVLWEEV